MKETKSERGKPGTEERKSTQVMKRINSLQSVKKINDNSCINFLKKKNVKNDSFSYPCFIRCTKFLKIKLLNKQRSFYLSRKTFRRI